VQTRHVRTNGERGRFGVAAEVPIIVAWKV